MERTQPCRVPDGFRHLPKVPRTGRATEVLPQILLNTRPDTLRKANSKRKQVSGPIGSKGHAKRSWSRGLGPQSARSVAKALNFGRFLVQEDRLAKLQFSESVLAPGGDSGQHDVGLALKALEEKSLESSERDVLASLASFWEDSSMLDPLDPMTSSFRERETGPMELSSCDGLCGRSWAAQQAYCRSLMSSRNDSRTGPAQLSRDDETIPELHPELRKQDLQRSFSIFPEEVLMRLKDFRRRPVGDYHIDVPDTKADDSGSSRPQSSNSNVSFLDDMIPRPPRRSSKTSRISEDSDSNTPLAQGKALPVPSLEELREVMQGAQLPMIPLKVPPQPELMTLNADEELIQPDVSSPREELLRAIKVLNIFRWFCRLPPVQLEEDEAEVCDFLSNALILRQPVFLSESHLISRRISDLGHQLGGFLAKGDSTMMLHKESSLVSAITVGILCSHTVGWSYASTPAPERHAVRYPAQQRHDPGTGEPEMMQRAARHRDWHEEAPKERVSKGGFAMWLSFAQVKEPVTLQNLPEPLAGYRTLWEISDRWTHDKEPKVEKRPEAPMPRPRTNGSSCRSRPGTVGTMGTAASNGSKEDRPNTSSSRVRQVFWGSTESAKRREWQRACNLSWGDRSRSLILRRQLLNSKLRSMGGSRVNDTCVLRAPPSADASKEDEPDFVVFPPEGVCPMELLVGCHLPTWTIMPDSQQFQPSHSLQVRMWRVRLLRREDTADAEADPTERRSRSSYPLPEEPPYDAIRLEELPLSFLTCDCAAEGNSFCIIFRPQLSRISEGDQLEVELLGLRGSSQRHHFFHEFRSCGELAWQDHEFFEEVQNFCKMFSDIDVFKGTLPALPKTLSRSFSLADNSLPDLRPISHLSKDFKTDDMELSMYFYCAGAAAFEADLYLQRSDGKIKVDRSTLVFNLDDHFLVRVKLPCSVSKYELAFRLSTTQRPRKLVEHPLKYSIRSLESRSFPLTTVEDPPSQKYQRYGFCPVPPTAQLLGMTILAPMEYGLLPGSLYFLVHIQPACLPVEVPPEPVGEMRPTQLFERLRCDHEEAEERALEMQVIKQKDPLFSAERGDASTRMDEMLRRRSFQNTQRMMLHRPSVAAMDPTVNVMRRLHHGLELHLAERTQDLPQMMHLDLVVRESRSNQQRFALRLQRKLDHPEFYEGVLHLADHDPGAKIELYYRITEETYRAPLKVGEWRVGRLNEALDD